MVNPGKYKTDSAGSAVVITASGQADVPDQLGKRDKDGSQVGAGGGDENLAGSIIVAPGEFRISFEDIERS